MEIIPNSHSTMAHAPATSTQAQSQEERLEYFCTVKSKDMHEGTGGDCWCVDLEKINEGFKREELIAHGSTRDIVRDEVSGLRGRMKLFEGIEEGSDMPGRRTCVSCT